MRSDETHRKEQLKMSLIKVSKGLHSGRRNRILMETIEFQERLFKRMQENDFPLFEKIKMTKIIKSNIEEFCHLKLGKANARTLNLIIRKIIHLYHRIGMYLTIEINRCDIDQLIDHSTKDGIFARHYNPVTVVYEDRIKTKNKDNCPNNLSFIFVEYGREIDDISFDQFVIPTPKIIFGTFRYCFNKLQPSSIKSISSIIVLVSAVIYGSHSAQLITTCSILDKS